MDSDTITIVTVYDHPLDWPDGFVLTAWGTKQGEPEPVLLWRRTSFGSVSAARLFILELSPGAICLGRTGGDDAVIVESWMLEPGAGLKGEGND